MSPAPPVDRRAFLRRLKFDLHGLPPTPAEINEYLSDPAANADSGLVDRLLDSPHYGERWARRWLDLVRYSETNGHEFDNDKNDAWRYRDYRIRAFNQDLPYPQLIREHLAGDLLPEPRLSRDGAILESPLGTSFFWFEEVLNSATDSFKARADRVDNQIDVLTKTFLGLTVSCARCHHHKFDPVPTRDYYALAGVMHSTYVREAVIDSPSRRAEIEAARAEIARRKPDPALAPAKIHLRPGDELLPSFDREDWWHAEGQAFGTRKRDQALSSRGEGHSALVGSLTSVKMRMPRMFVHVRLAGSKPNPKVYSGGDLRLTLVADDHKSEHFFAASRQWGWQSMPMTKEISRQ